MKRREFLKQAALTAATVASASQMQASGKTPSNPIARRTLGKTGEKLSMIGFGGIVVMDEEPGAASNIVAEAVDRGINYFDIAPSYGNAQERLGPALAPYRKNVLPGLQDRGPHEGRLPQATRRVAAPAQDRSRGPLPVPRAHQDEGTGQGARSRRRHGDHGSREEGRQDPLHRLLRPLRRKPRWPRSIATTSTPCCSR